MGDCVQILDQFKTDLTRVSHLLGLIKGFRDFASSEVPAGDAGPWAPAHALHIKATNVRTDLPILSGSILLYLAGRFEYFIRQIIQCAAEEIAANADAYSGLPDTLRNELRVRTLEIAQAPRRYGYDDVEADALLAKLVGTIGGTVQVADIGAEVLTITEANMRGKVIAELMKRIGLSEFWVSVGKQAQLKIHLRKAADGDTTAEAQNRLNKIMDDRNQIAHPTAATQFPDPDQVLAHAAFLSCLGTTTVDVVLVYLASKQKQDAA